MSLLNQRRLRGVELHTFDVGFGRQSLQILAHRIGPGVVVQGLTHSRAGVLKRYGLSVLAFLHLHEMQAKSAVHEPRNHPHFGRGKDLGSELGRAICACQPSQFPALLRARAVGPLPCHVRKLGGVLRVGGTQFEQKVWQALCGIPVGRTRSYGEVGRDIGVPEAVRAVAGACAANVLAIAIPCHRVVRSDGSISGYRWGVERTRALLAEEAGAAAMESAA